MKNINNTVDIILSNRNLYEYLSFLTLEMQTIAKNIFLLLGFWSKNQVMMINLTKADSNYDFQKKK